MAKGEVNKMSIRVLKKALSLMLVTFCVVGCASGQGDITNREQVQEASAITNIKVLITGSLGDRAFNDSVADGVAHMEASLGDKVSVRLLEMGNDKSRYEGALLDASESEADIIIVGTWDLKELLEETAPLYPEKRYIIYDTDVDYSLGNLENVYSVGYKQNESGFMAGVLAGLVTKSDMPYTNDNQSIGFIGATETATVINDFLVGFIEGAQFVNPDVEIRVAYVNSYTDVAKAKEIALAQYAAGVDCIFAAAGPGVVGVIEAAAERGHYVIGVDSDQTLAYEGRVELPYILTSAMKNVGETLYNLVEQDVEGTLVYGAHHILGIEDEVIGLAENSHYQDAVPESIRLEVTRIKEMLVSGEIVAGSIYDIGEAGFSDLMSRIQ